MQSMHPQPLKTFSPTLAVVTMMAPYSIGSSTTSWSRVADPHSATAQFFINVKDNDFLNHSGKTMQGWGYTVFGKVVGGEDVLEKIRKVPTTSRGGHQDVPSEAVIIESISVDDDVDQ